MEWVKTISLSLFSWIVITVLLSWLLAAAYPILRRSLLNCPASLRASLTLLLGLTPGLLALTVLLIYSSEYWATYFIAAHCHDTTCGPHTLHMPVSTKFGFASLSFAMGTFLLISLLILRQIINSQRYLQMLKHFSHGGPDLNYRIIETDTPVAWCAGMLHPQIYLSRGLLKKLSPKQLDTVLAHEHAHLIHRDNIRKQLLHWSTVVWPRPIAAYIRKDFAQDIEVVCDVSAALRCKQGKQSIDNTMSLIHDYCSEGNIENGMQECSMRLSLLQREVRLLRGELGGNQVLKCRLLLNTAVIGVVLLLGTAYFSHPLIEWLSR